MTDAPDFTPGAYSFEARKLVDKGREIEPDVIWTYGDISHILGRVVKGSTPSLQSAIRRLSRDHGIEFKNVRSVGYIRLNDAGIIDMGPQDRQAISRRTRRASQRSANVNWEKLADEQKREVDSHRTLVAMMRQLLKPSAMKRIHSEVTRVHDQLDIDQTLKLFRNKYDV